ncbi:hypothetical protein GMDG_02856 [Pseudogymnoascus destructans 20631-21]|uniref:Integrase catalytic domain-containing protein n=1 Tax=Pseudogymnoascus destructans (strain ATCC MYA-4855 / 20631-21) TaxID=658429 RepID=L8G5R4_PSED2|nr:hypothetical protein GMDG_02856 [Pseudogymnoascus destructans 20631-21]
MAQLFIEWIYRFGHTPESIVSDRGPQFVSSFWQEFCQIIGIKIKLSTAYHKQTDGQTEIMNRYIDQRLRPFVSHYQGNWSELIPIMDHVQMTLPHASIGMTPYRLKYGTDPRTSWDWNTLKSTNPRETLNREEAKAVADECIPHGSTQRKTWQRHKRKCLSTQIDAKGPSTGTHKLGQQWVGPYTVSERIGHAFRLELPTGSQIHDVFSPDVLMKDPNNPLPGQDPPEPSSELIDGVEEWEVEKILAVRLHWKQLQYQVSWVGYDPDPEWYPASNFMNSPHKLREFHTEYPELPGPPQELLGWVSAGKARGTKLRSREGQQSGRNRVVAIYDSNYPLIQGALTTVTLAGATLPKRLTGIATSGYHHERRRVEATPREESGPSPLRHSSPTPSLPILHTKGALPLPLPPPPSFLRPARTGTIAAVAATAGSLPTAATTSSRRAGTPPCSVQR